MVQWEGFGFGPGKGWERWTEPGEPRAPAKRRPSSRPRGHGELPCICFKQRSFSRCELSVGMAGLTIPEV